MTSKPYFIIKKNLQKSLQTGEYFSDQVTPKVLKDVCFKITGRSDFDYKYVDNSFHNEEIGATYNKGRLAILYYNNNICYITFSEVNVRGRNSSIQSVPTAFNLFYSNNKDNKSLYYYFLGTNGNLETFYHKFIYRLMKTVGFKFVNEEILNDNIQPFTSIPDLMLSRRINSGRNQSNNPTYITKSSSKNIDLYGKTYGASKYETSLLCYAISKIAQNNNALITLYQVAEGNLQVLPQSSLDVIHNMGNIRIIQSNQQLERIAFCDNDSLRSPKYIYNLFERIGEKRCALCGCEIPEIIQGAHILPVATIKKYNMSFEEKLAHATSGHNGLWLCENHHKLFDENIINISNDGEVLISSNLNENDKAFLSNITTKSRISPKIMSKSFVRYLQQRNSVVNF